MLRLAHAHVRAVEKHALHHRVRQRALFVDGERHMQRRLVDRLRGAHARDQRHDGFPQIREEAIQRLGREPGLVFVQKVVVGAQLRPHVSGEAAQRAHDFVDVRREPRVVVGELRLVPHGGGLVGQPLELDVFVHRNPRRLLHAAQKQRHNAVRLLVQLVLGGLQRGQNFARFVAGDQLVDFLVQHA